MTPASSCLIQVIPPRPCLSDTSLLAVTIFVHQFALASVPKGTKERKENPQGVQGSDASAEPPKNWLRWGEGEKVSGPQGHKPDLSKVPEILNKRQVLKYLGYS